MKYKSLFLMAVSATLATAGTINYTCDPNVLVTPGVCNTLNTTIAGLYNSTFSNVNASIYIQYGTTDLGSSTQGLDNQISYSAYLAALTAASIASGDPVQISAVAALNALDTPIYGSGNVDLPTALGTALGISGLTGTTSGGSACTIGISGCYDGIITITNDPSTLLYYRNGPQDPASYDYFTVVEHETNEVLGTSSCIGTTGAALVNDCPGTGTPAAVDLYRYLSPGNLVLLNSTPGAYFSFDGGATNGAAGSVYNTISNGDDYADFISGCPASTRIQDGTACPGQTGVDITNDGKPEINILNAIGYRIGSSSTATPEPGTMGLLAAALGCFGLYHRRRRA